MLLNFVLVCCFAFSSAAIAGDLVNHLPGLKSLPSFKQYSGYLEATSTKHFHYWFVESQNDPANDPVVLWLNGGPGCSSLDGYLSENGPLHVDDDGETLNSNPYSWNKIANVLYLESPAGVGYSYDDNGAVKTNDDEVSLNNYNALVDFFKKFSEFGPNPFFITGESYGGIYLPTLAVRIMQGAAKINFKGMAVGNGLSSFSINDDSLIFFAYYHGLFGTSLWKMLTKHCCNGAESQENCHFSSNSDIQCKNAVTQGMNLVYNSGLNEYALYLDCYGNPGTNTQRYNVDMRNLFTRNNKVQQQMRISEQKMAKLFHEMPQNRVGVTPPCINSTAEINWLNKPDVRSALHIKPNLPDWNVCSDAVNGEYITVYENMTAQYFQLLKNPNFRILLYNGDTDMACNFLGDEWFVESLKQNVTKDRGPWYVEGQVAGFAKQFGQLTYTTIRGAGHMVPQWAPTYAFSMFDKFLNNKPFN